MGFSPRTETLLHHAGQICEAKGARLTDLRREVLGLILDSDAPTGAYDLLDRCAPSGTARRRPRCTGRWSSCWNKGWCTSWKVCRPMSAASATATPITRRSS